LNTKRLIILAAILLASAGANRAAREEYETRVLAFLGQMAESR